MAKRIGLIGVPLEDLYVEGQTMLVSTYIPHITNGLRKAVVEETNKRSISVRDIGEVFLGEDYDRPYPTDRYDEVPDRFIRDMRWRDMRLLERARDKALTLSRYYDLLVAVGHSHLGAIVLYDNLESVARLDYHSDYTKCSYRSLMVNFACYMNWVEQNILLSEVTNYFTNCLKDGKPMDVFDRRAGSIDDKSYRHAKHIDIDVDCVDWEYHIQDSYRQDERLGGPTGVSPDDVVRMVGEARPNKLGIWEYRLNHDRSGGLGVKMIADCIEAAVKR